MSNILALLGSLSFLDALWLFPVAVAIHEAEEWNVVKWYERNYTGLPPMTDKSARLSLAFVTVVGFIWSAVAILTRNPAVAAFVLLPAMTFVFLNALQHIFWVFYFRQYAPGVITSALLLIPVIGYLTVRAVQQHYAPIWYVIGLIVIFVAPGFVQTVRAGNTITPPMRAIHQVGITLSSKL